MGYPGNQVIACLTKNQHFSTIKYIIIVFALILASLCTLAIISLIIVSKNDIKPANYVEQAVEEWIDSCKQKGSIEIESFPEDADYVRKANDGKMRQKS